MPLEDDVPTRRDIERLLARENQAEKKKDNSKKRVHLSDKAEEKALEAKKKRQDEYVRQNLDDNFSNIPEHAKQKILSDLDSYKHRPRTKRVTRQF